MKRRTRPSKIAPRLLVAGVLVALGAALGSATPARADEYDQLRRHPTLRAPRAVPKGLQIQAPGPGEIIVIPGQPVMPPAPRPPQHWNPNAVIGLSETDAARGAVDPAPGFAWPVWKGVLGWFWLAGWRYY